MRIPFLWEDIYEGIFMHGLEKIPWGFGMKVMNGIDEVHSVRS